MSWRRDRPHHDISGILLLNTYTNMLPVHGSVIFGSTLGLTISGRNNTGDEDWEISQYVLQRPPSMPDDERFGLLEMYCDRVSSSP